MATTAAKVAAFTPAPGVSAVTDGVGTALDAAGAVASLKAKSVILDAIVEEDTGPFGAGLPAVDPFNMDRIIASAICAGDANAVAVVFPPVVFDGSVSPNKVA